MLKKSNIVNILETLVVLSVILELNSVYSIMLRMTTPLRVSFFCIIFLALLILLKGKKIKLKKTLIYSILLFDMGLVMATLCLNFSGLKTTIIYYVLMLLLFCIYFSMYGKPAIMGMCKKFVQIVLILSVISLFFWVTADVFKILKPTNAVYIDFGSYNNEPRQISSYFNLHFDTQKMGIAGFILIRNSGIFCEAPMYAIILLITFMFQLLVDEIEFSKRNFYILLVTIISTVTTTGIICTSLMLFLAFMYKDFEVKILKQIKYILLPVLLLIICMFFFNIIEDKSTTKSYLNRTMDYRNAFEVFKEYPLFGKGINHDHAYEDEYLKGYGYSNSVSKILTDGGIYLLVFYIVALNQFVRYGMRIKDRNILIMACICVVFFALIIIVHNALSIFLVSMAFCLNDKEEVEG